jgi:hypothetical protein
LQAQSSCSHIISNAYVRLILNLRCISYRSANLSQYITLPSVSVSPIFFIWSPWFQKTLHPSSLPSSSSSPPNVRNRSKCYIYHLFSPLSTIYLCYSRRLHRRWQAAPLLPSQSPLVTRVFFLGRNFRDFGENRFYRLPPRKRNTERNSPVFK